MTVTHRSFTVGMTLQFCVIFLLAGGITEASNFWQTKPWTEWDKKEVLRFLDDSPWVENYYTYLTNLRDVLQTRPEFGAAPRECIRLRFLTAKPVRLAYARLGMLEHPDAQLDSTEVARQFLDPWPDQIVIAFQPDAEQGTRSREWIVDVDRKLREWTTEQLKRKVYLISEKLGRVEMVEYIPPGPDGIGAKLVFPRTVQGQPVIAPDADSVAFEGFGLYVTWKLDKMLFDGDLTY